MLGDQTRNNFIAGVRRYKSDVMDIKIDRETLKKRWQGYIDAAKKNGLKTTSQVAWYYLECDVYQLLECVRFYMEIIFSENGLNPFGYVRAHVH